MDAPETMTAAVTMRHGGPDATVIRHDWPVPAAEPDQVLIRVTAAALNNTDIWSREGAYGTPEDPDAIAGWLGVPLVFPRVQGIDVCGVVEVVGERVDPMWKGRRVLVDPTVEYRDDFPVALIGSEVDGGFAQFNSCAVGQVHDVTESTLSDDQLACLPTAFGTALGMINRGGCAAGERVLVTGASGGVGGAAIQLLAARGCHVVARTSDAKRDQVRRLGAHELSVRGVDPIDAVDEVDVVIDVVGGEEFGPILDRLRDGGRMVTAGAIAGPVVSLDVRRLYLRQRRLIGSTMSTPADFEELATAARNGTVQPEVAATFDLVDLARAQERFTSKDFTGKIVVVP